MNENENENENDENDENDEREHSFDCSQDSIHSISPSKIPLPSLPTPTTGISIHPKSIMIELIDHQIDLPSHFSSSPCLSIEKKVDDEQVSVNHTIVSDEEISSKDEIISQSQSLEKKNENENENENENKVEVEKVVDCFSYLADLPGQEDLFDKMNTPSYPTPCFLSHSFNPLISIPIPIPMTKPMPMLKNECGDEMHIGNYTHLSDMFDYVSSLQQ